MGKAFLCDNGGGSSVGTSLYVSTISREKSISFTTSRGRTLIQILIPDVDGYTPIGLLGYNFGGSGTTTYLSYMGVVRSIIGTSIDTNEYYGQTCAQIYVSHYYTSSKTVTFTVSAVVLYAKIGTYTSGGSDSAMSKDLDEE